MLPESLGESVRGDRTLADLGGGGMQDYETTDKTAWFIQKLSSEWLSRQEILAIAAKEFPTTPRKKLDGTIGQYWSDCVNPKWWTNQNIQRRGLKVVKSGRRRHIERSTGVARTGTPADRGGRGQSGGPPNQHAWDEGRNAPVQFLGDLKTILSHVVTERIVMDPTKLTEPDPLFLANLKDATNSIDQVIKDLNEDKTGKKWHEPLRNVGLAGKGLWVKMRDMYDAVSAKSLSVVLEIADVIVGSMSKVFPVLEPVKELKEIAEARVKYGGDKPLLTTLNISGREQVDWDSKATQ